MMRNNINIIKITEIILFGIAKVRRNVNNSGLLTYLTN